MATPQPPAAAEAEKKPKVKGGQHQFPCRSFQPKKPAFTVPTQGLAHIIFDNTGTAKVVSTFNLNIEAISEQVTNRLKFDSPIAALAVCKLKTPTVDFPPNPPNSANLVKTTKQWQRKYNHAHNNQKWWDKNTQKIYNLVMQYTAPETKTKLLMMDWWTSTSATQDGITFLKTICNICHKKDGGTNATTILDLIRMDKDMYLILQAPNELLLSLSLKIQGGG
jgi:hypothetical protein